ncbi:hypothetical protein J3R82DRAFT_1076 [Butyriboletus roseoflavus]|nr:hypothetical protein J3R82DRAFT_1076 [Butyriboletus roseoflavus]
MPNCDISSSSFLKGIIAVDLDDVLSGTNEHIAAWHNEKYGSEIGLNDFYYYYYWKNPCWGPPAQTHKKVRDFYATDWVSSILPIDGAQEGTAALRRLGYRLVIITARNEHVRDTSWEWTKRHFPGCFEEIICTGQFALQQRLDGVPGVDQGNVIPKKLSKAEVCIRIGAKLLIDDSLENAVACAEYVSPSGDGLAPPVLLFGDYQWNKRISLPEDEHDDMVYERRVELENGSTDFLVEDARQGEEALARANEKCQNFVQRVKDWKAVVSYVEASEV